MSGALTVLFIVLASFIGPLQYLDSYAVASFAVSFPYLSSFMLLITDIGSPIGMFSLALFWMCFELAQKNRKRALVMFVSLVSFPVFSALKLLFQRSRPVTEYVEMLSLQSYSFPSGHALMSCAVLMTFAYLLSLRLPHRWVKLSTGCLLLFVILVGVSRVYLGAHYPTDVLGGWIIGAVIVMLAMLITIPKNESKKTFK